MVQRGEVDIGGGMFSLMKERAVTFSPKSLLSSFFVRQLWISAMALVLRKIQSWWKLQGFQMSPILIFLLFPSPSAASLSLSSGGLPSPHRSGWASGSPPSPWPSSCSSSSQGSRSRSSLTHRQRQWDLSRLSGSFSELWWSRLDEIVFVTSTY